jgi:hypothetical protein
MCLEFLAINWHSPLTFRGDQPSSFLAENSLQDLPDIQSRVLSAHGRNFGEDQACTLIGTRCAA